MIAICVGVSHKQGLGHLYRCLNLIKLLRKYKKKYILIVNRYNPAVKILENEKINFVIKNQKSKYNWQKSVINSHRVKLWINDYLNTPIRFAKRIKENNIPLILIDDIGKGIKFSDKNIFSLPSTCKKEFDLSNLKYLILSDEIKKYKKKRSKLKKIIISIGGTDTYGLSFFVLSYIINLDLKITLIVGPGFKNKKVLKNISNKITIKNHPKSLMKEFSKNDLLISGGGITAFESVASGLPTMIIATERHEIKNAKFLEKIGCAVYVGYRKSFDFKNKFKTIDIRKMSTNGLHKIKVNGSENIFKIINQMEN